MTYRFQPKPGLAWRPESPADYEYIIFGGNDPDMAIGGSLRRMLPFDVQVALRDAEKDLANWRHSPLRPLIEELSNSLGGDTRTDIQDAINSAQSDFVGRDEVGAMADRIADRLVEMAGEQHAVPVTLGLSPTRIDALLRGLRILIDDGARGIAEASLGTANLIFLALKSLQLDRLVSDNERDHTFFAVEEPEAHLHPHVQRLVYRYFLSEDDGERERNLTTILTTHSPHIASVTPIRSLVLLRYDRERACTVAVSTALTPLTDREQADLQRYIDVTRGEIFFARGVILVEGDAERFLVPAFAEALDIPLDILGISVCSVGGTNFAPYVKLLAAAGLGIPHVILTDRDPNGDRPPLVRRRLINLLQILDEGVDYRSLDVDTIIDRAEAFGCFVNGNTLETELFAEGLGEAILEVLEEELPLREATLVDIRSWIDDTETLDESRLIGLIERIGKGRFAQALASRVSAAVCPGYIVRALEHIRDAVT